MTTGISVKPIKAVRAGKNPSFGQAFYLIQRNVGMQRYVISLPDKEKIRELLLEFIKSLLKKPLVKIRHFYEDEEEGTDYSGSVKVKRLVKCLEIHEDVIFHNGMHDFMVMDPQTEDYLVFDEHGLLYFYTNENCPALFKGFDIPFVPDQKLLYEYDHWHFSIADGQNKIAEMIRFLKFESCVW